MQYPWYHVTCLQAAVKRLLSDSEDVVREDVGPLIKTVVATNKFEKEMAALFGGPGGAKDEDEDDLQVIHCLLAVSSMCETGDGFTNITCSPAGAMSR